MRLMQGTVAVLAALWALGACSPSEPVKIGYLGGMSGRGADLGTAGRDGVLLAVEEVNAAGGINGRKVELTMIDDGQKSETALQAVETFKKSGVDVIVGPMTSSIAEAILPSLQQHNLLAISPTVAASSLTGQDDAFLKVAPSVPVYANLSAEYQYAQGRRKMALVADEGNKAFTGDWAHHFERRFKEIGGSVVASVTFKSGDDVSYTRAIEETATQNPDGFLLICNAVDTVRLNQILRNKGLQQAVAASSWAATEGFLQLGGRGVEGVNLVQFFDRADQSARYTAFAAKFKERFRTDPGFASIAAYDSAQAVFQALRKGSAQPIKAALLTSGPYEGLQEFWTFDRFGDSNRKARLTVVRDGAFQVVR